MPLTVWTITFSSDWSSNILSRVSKARDSDVPARVLQALTICFKKHHNLDNNTQGTISDCYVNIQLKDVISQNAACFLSCSIAIGSRVQSAVSSSKCPHVAQRGSESDSGTCRRSFYQGSPSLWTLPQIICSLACRAIRPTLDNQMRPTLLVTAR